MASNRFPKFPGSGFAADNTEDAACRCALRVIGLSAALFAKVADLPSAASKITFAKLCDPGLTAFPVRPLVSGETPDEPSDLLNKFHKSQMLSVWEASGRPRVVVFRGGSLGLCVLYPTKQPPARAHICLVHPERFFMAVEEFRPWCAAISSWDGGELAEYRKVSEPD